MPDTPMRRLRIAIASSGRFHVLDLARELRARGHEVNLYAHVSRRRAEAFGLAAEAVVPLTLPAAPFLAWRHFLPRLAPSLCKRLYFRTLNLAVIRRLAPCDVFVGMSGIYLEAAEYARAAHGAMIFLERASMHIDVQQSILRAEREHGPETQFTRQRELAGYAMTDRISVPSFHVAKSFDHDSHAAGKLVLNPYGVDLNMFPSEPCRSPTRRRVLTVGGWSFRKGVDTLVNAIKQIDGTELVHVGSIGDVPFPDGEGFTHVDPVDQSALSAFYHDADVFVLASREDGFGMVLLQALASGLPCVASDRTGGPTIHRVWPEIAPLVRLVPEGNADALAAAIAATLDDPPAPMSPEARDRLSWAAYGARYESAIFDALRQGLA